MQLVGQKVEHGMFGQGLITDCSDNIVTVSFPQGDKKFIYPDAFASFITLKDGSIQNEIQAGIDKQLEAAAAKNQALAEEHARRQRIRNLKITPNSQAAFNVDMNELDEIFAAGAVSTGCYLSGYSKGEPRIPSKLRPNSACLLTVLPPDSPEKERQILGAFMVKEDFWGDSCSNGMVEAHEQHTLRLGAENSLLFWDYFDYNEPIPRWGRTVFKYFPNSTMQKVLLDFMQALQGTEDEPLIQEFYQYFCKINRLPK